MNLYALNNAVRVLPRWLRQTLLVMKITTLILITCLLQVSATTFGQRITLNQSNTALEKVLKEIRAQSGYNFIYNADLIENAKAVTIKVKNATVEEALEQILKNQQLSFEIKDKTIILDKKEKSFFEKVVDRFQTTDVYGRVVDSDGQPLVGATVRVKNGKGSAITGNDGRFTIKNVEQDAVLMISYLGYVNKEVVANNDLTRIVMVLSDNKLDEVQIQAYGTVQKKFSTSNSGTITAKEIGQQPVSNPLLALQGRVPGLFIKQTTGVGAGNVSVVIQGQNSIVQGNTPFYVIDGVPFIAQNGQSLISGAVPGLSGSNFNFVNPDDIESVTILKDADATAIYGSRAANGAILITTKKGKAGKTKIDVNFRTGGGKITRKLDLLNRTQYFEMRKEAYKNDGLEVPTSTTAPIRSNYDLTLWDQNKNTDWQDVLVGGTAMFTDLQTSVSGGNEQTQFIVGGNYNRQTTVYPGNLGEAKGGSRFSLNHNSLDKRFKFVLTTSYLYAKNNLSGGGDLMSKAVSLAPNAPKLYNTDGSINWEPVPGQVNVTSFDNPLAYLQNKYQSLSNNMISNGQISYEIIKGLELKVSGGYNRLEINEIKTIPSTYYKPDFNITTGSSNFLNRSVSSYIIEPQLHFSKEIKKNAVDLLFGSTFQQSLTNTLGVNAGGFSNNDQLNNILAATLVTPSSLSGELRYKYSAMFARVNYRYNNKYILNLTARRDGSSRFGAENQLHSFYGVGAAWLFGEENYMKQLIPFLSQGKLRFSYGTTGNDQIDDYAYLSLLTIYRQDVPYQNSAALQAQRHANAYLQWEETRKLNIGMDLGFWSQRISLSADYFRNRSSNQLTDYKLPWTTGFSSVTQNFPALVQNTGWEVLMNAIAIKKSDFNWQISANATIPHNKLLDFPGLANSTYFDQLVVGYPVNIQKAFQFAGLDPQTGLFQFINAKGETSSIVDYDLDKTRIVHTNPDWYGGFSNSFTYKRFSLDILLQYVNQTGLNPKYTGNVPGYAGFNYPTYVLDRWRNIGDHSSMEKFTTTLFSDSWSAAGSSTAKYTDASFLRLKNVSLSYNLPEKNLRRAGISYMRIYLQGQNLFTWTDFYGADPETQSPSVLPPLKMYTVGIQLSL